MVAYIINDMEVIDPALMEEYKKLSPATVRQYGGRFLARGGRTEILEGTWSPRRLVILEFPSMEQAEAWVDSPEYAPAKALRQRASRSNLIVAEGISMPGQGPAMAKTYVKRLGILRKKEGMSHQQFVDHWLNTHATLCARLPKLRRYSVNFVDRQRFQKFGYDGFSELWFDSEEDLSSALSSPEGRTLMADLPNLTDDINPIIAVEHQVVWP